jgi:hypothetical protein
MGVRYQIDDGEDFSVVSFLQDGAEIGQIEITEKPVSEKWLVAGVPVSSPNQLLTDRIRALHTRLAKRNMVRESDLRDVEYLISLGAQATRKDMRAKALQYGRGEEWERSVNRELLNRIPGNTYPGVSSLVARLAP